MKNIINRMLVYLFLLYLVIFILILVKNLDLFKDTQ
jgi:hypothetical protein